MPIRIHNMVRVRMPSKKTLNLIGIALLVAEVLLLIALLHPIHIWTKTSSLQSCHLCRNRRHVLGHYRWGELQSERVKPMTDFDISAEHRHVWHGYDFNEFVWDYLLRKYVFFRGGSGPRYRDGSHNP